jgi:hypothetical protein
MCMHVFHDSQSEIRLRRCLYTATDSSTVPRYILVRENMRLTHSHHPTRTTGNESDTAISINI